MPSRWDELEDEDGELVTAVELVDDEVDGTDATLALSLRCMESTARST